MNLKCLFAFILLFTSGMVFASENLIVNSSFEMNTQTGLPRAWYPSKNANGEIVTGPDGKNALSITGPKNGAFYYWIQNLGRIEAGKIYRLKGKFKATEGTQVMVYLETSAPWQTISTKILKGNGDWQDFQIKQIKFRPFEKPPYLICRIKSPGTGIFAGLELIELEPRKINLIRNADFSETGSDGLTKYWFVSKDGQWGTIDDPEGKCLQIKGMQNGKITILTQANISIKANRKYQLTAFYKGSQGSEFSAYIETPKPVWQTKITPWQKCSGQWQKLSLQFSFSDFTERPYLGLRVKGHGNVLIRDPRITEMDGLLVNGKFTNGTNGWTIQGGSVVKSEEEFGNILELNSNSGAAQARQNGIQVRKGQYYELRFQVRGGSDKSHRDSQNAVWFRAIVLMNGKIISSSDWMDSFDAWQKKTVLFCPRENGKIDILLDAKVPYCVDFDNIELVPVKQPVPPLVILPNPPFTFRNGLYSVSRKCRKGIFSIVNNTVPQTIKYRVLFNGKKYQIPHGKNTVFELEIPTDVGIYPIQVDAEDSVGKILATVSLPFQVNPPAQREITFRADRVMLIDGEPFFPLGVWTIHGNKTNLEKAKIAAETGFNTARSTQGQIDDFAENGLMVLLPVPENLPNFKDAAQFNRWDQKFRKTMHKYQTHPSLLGYFNTDEPAWRGVSSEKLLEAYKYICTVDPFRPVVLNEAPRGNIPDLRHYADAGDVYGVDIYPVPEPNPHSGLTDKNMTSVGKYVDLCRQVVYDRKPIWMTLQAFAWGNISIQPNQQLIFPTEQQNRFMAYNAIVHGATGLFWYGINEGKCENWDFVRKLGKTVHELRKMSAILVAETIQPAGLKSSSPEVKILHKRLNGIDWYIAINESNKELAVDFCQAGTETINVFFENRKIIPAAGVFRDTLKGYDIHVYSSANNLPPPLKTPKTRRMAPRVNVPDSYRNANWIWFPGKNHTPGHKACFKREITLDSVPEKALFFAAADDFFQLYVNNQPLMKGTGWNRLVFRDAAKFLKVGKNTILIKAADAGSAPCGLLYAAVITQPGGKEIKIYSDSETMASEDNQTWVKSQILCKFGQTPWGNMSNPRPAF